MVRFSRIEHIGPGEIREVEVREIKQSDLLKCPHCIMDPKHFNQDGTCKCRDPQAREMIDWGYKWDQKSKMWK